MKDEFTSAKPWILEVQVEPLSQKARTPKGSSKSPGLGAGWGQGQTWCECGPRLGLGVVRLSRASGIPGAHQIEVTAPSHPQCDS